MAESFNGIIIEDDRIVDEPIELHNLQVTGNCSFLENVEANVIDVSGSAIFKAFVSCDRLDVSGEAIVTQKLLTETVRATGNIEIIGKIFTEVAVFEGRATARGGMSASRVVVKADSVLESDSKIKVDRITVNGTILFGAKLKCTEFEVASCETSKLSDIAADSVIVRYKARADRPNISDGDFIVTSSFVDTNRFDAEYMYADSVYCDEAMVGEGCVIRELVYRDTVEISRGAVVERLSKA